MTSPMSQRVSNITAVSQRNILETVSGRIALELGVLDHDDFTQVMAADRGSDERIHLVLMARQSS